MALVSSIAAMESAAATILVYRLGGNIIQAENEIRKSRFLDRFNKVLPKYGTPLPPHLFDLLKQAYAVRNGIVHGLKPITAAKCSKHVCDLVEVLAWYWQNVK